MNTQATAQLYCPKCGHLLSFDGKYWQCVSGRTDFSIVLGNRLEKDFAAAFIPGRERQEVTRKSGDFFCPACATPTPKGATRPGDERPGCPTCGIALTWFHIYQLVEIHPHWDGVAGWN